MKMDIFKWLGVILTRLIYYDPFAKLIEISFIKLLLLYINLNYDKL